MRAVSIYIHVPFCRRRCSYCTFYHVPCVDDLETAYVDAVVSEILDLPETVGEEFEAPTVFVGGGSPSVLQRGAFDRIFAAVSRYLPREAVPEITVETNPEDVTDDLLVGFEELGVNRLSLGIQSMDDGGLRVLRRCTPAVNRIAMAKVAEHFDNFSVDVLLGIPGGAVQKVESALSEVLVFEPSHLSVYCLEGGGDMPVPVRGFFERVDSERAADEYLAVCERLERCGYTHYEVSNFARGGMASRHNRAYWSGSEYLGVGPGAHSFIGGERYFNEPSIERYVATRAGRGASIRRHETRSPAQRELESKMLALRTSRGISVGRIGGPPGLPRELIRDGFAVLRGNRMALTDRGYLVLDEILCRCSGGAIDVV